MRHGTTFWNEKGIVQGRSQNKLSPRGISLVEESAKNYENVSFDLFIVSPLMRTRQTANIMQRNRKVKKIYDDRLLETDEGFFTKFDKKYMTPEQRKLKKLRSKQAGMETYEEIWSRLADFFEYLKSLKEYNDVLVVTHGCCATLLQDMATNVKLDLDNRKTFDDFNNAEIKKFVI